MEYKICDIQELPENRDGYCIYGPCQGDKLKPVLLRIENNKLLLTLNPERYGINCL